MVTKSYFRLILFTILIFFSNSLLYSMDNKNTELDLEKALNLYQKGDILIIDIRTTNEWIMTGVIPNSILINMHDADNQERKEFLEELKKELSDNENKRISFICASGARSKIVAEFFIKEGYKNISHIPDGILGKRNDGWLFQGYPIVKYNKKKDKK